ncbi:M20/M25/M40 family metallo-hydrolase [Pelotomaculum sp. PtaB.Bin117]|uniref:M20/M25/M40 family metallo-hydrolase n=1 Tax=Pelotomaculum sp. PtaB.Bin117 TaxID=1811694 RepID=UPI0009D4ED24|nr:M20/M25/M40 family metallo-hydrolase [Pelotomaculum sp. PtaB.Bin117]OPX91745.1 MAG: putative succinyl-diaminopimelate desuccinylase [Pelotomaculum sp. PtaB.Bin117]
MPLLSDQTLICRRPAELLQNLIRFNTTNPPGDEAACIAYINNLLTEAGLETTILARDPGRPNLITRLTGQGDAPPLLLYGHADVVTAENQVWRYPPFEGTIAEGCVWGRGALDMKGGLAMMLAACLRAKAENLALPGDIVLAVLSDEESGGDYGAKYLVNNHACLFKGIRYAIGELGGYSLRLGGQKFYMIMVAEKKLCWMKVTVRGPGGHGSIPLRGGAMAKLAQVLQQLEWRRLPVHITPVVRRMLDTMLPVLPDSTSPVIRRLLNPALTDSALAQLDESWQFLDPLLHNTVNATIVHGGHKINVIPSEISLQLDGRLLPGCTPEDMVRELREITGGQFEFELIQHGADPGEPDMGLFDTLAEILRKADPGCYPVPLLLSGCTDGHFFSQLGIQTYGYMPMNLPPEIEVSKLIHAADERIPVEALTFGAEAIYQVLQRFGNLKNIAAEKPDI